MNEVENSNLGEKIRESIKSMQRAVQEEARVRSICEAASSISAMILPPPANRWEAFKDRWFPAWLLRRCPVRRDQARAFYAALQHRCAAMMFAFCAGESDRETLMALEAGLILSRLLELDDDESSACP